MKRLKFYFILLFVVFITGCDVKYNIEIMDDKITETANFKLKNDVILKEKPYYTLEQISGKYFISTDFLITDEKKEYFNDNYGFVELKNNYEIENYINSYALDICYSAYNVTTDDDDNIKFSTSDKFLCYDHFSELSSLVVSVKTNHEVISHNADEVEDNEYKWIITEENSDNKPINFVVSGEVQQDSFIDSLAKNIFEIIIVIGVIAVAGIIVLISLKIKSNKANKL